MAKTVELEDRYERALDVALEMTFPASDPIAPAVPDPLRDSLAIDAGRPA